MTAKPTAELARYLFDYEPSTGLLTWKNPNARSVKPGDVAGTSTKKASRYVYVNDEPMMCTRLVWLIVHGKLPSSRILARNGDLKDLRIDNLYLQIAKKPPTRTAAFHARKSFVKSVWVRVLRDHVTTEWRSFEQFYAQVQDEVFKHCRFVRPNENKPIGPHNYKIESMAKFDRSTKQGREAYYKYKNSVNIDIRKRYEMRTKFGITLEEFKAKIIEQNGVCAICGEPETAVRNGQVMHLSVDHCHTTGAVRSLLCKGCNNGIGWFKENVNAMRAAADYIERHAAKHKSVPASNVIQLKQKER